MVVRVGVTAKKAANVSPDAVKQSSNPVALMEELLTFNLHTASLPVVLMEEPLTSGLRHVIDPIRADHHKGRPSPDRDSRYKEILSKFDKNKDGKLDEKERDEAKKYIMSRYRNYKK